MFHSVTHLVVYCALSFFVGWMILAGQSSSLGPGVLKFLVSFCAMFVAQYCIYVATMGFFSGHQ